MGAQVTHLDARVLSELVLDTQSPAQNLWCHSVKDERGGQRPGECLRVRRNERRQAATLQETVPTIPREEVGAPRRGRSDPACKAGIVLKLPLGRLAVGLEVGRVDVVEVPRASADGPFTTSRWIPCESDAGCEIVCVRLRGGEKRPHRRIIGDGDRKSTRLNSSHGYISYAVFCLKKKKQSQIKI